MDSLSRRSVLAAGGCVGLGLVSGCTSGVSNALGGSAGPEGKGLYYPTSGDSSPGLLGLPARLRIAKPQEVRDAYPDNQNDFELIQALNSIEQTAFRINMENERRIVSIAEQGNMEFIAFECTYDQQRLVERLRANYSSMYAIDTSYKDHQILGSTRDTTNVMAFGPDDEGWLWNVSYESHSIQEVVDDMKSKIDLADGNGNSAIGTVPGLKQILGNVERSLSLTAALGYESTPFLSSGIGLSERNSTEVSANVFGYVSENSEVPATELKTRLLERLPVPQDVDPASISLNRNDRLVTIEIPIPVDRIPTY